ncbi:hypothetical protein ACLOJK_040496 [Asimina triloba]
MQKNLLDRPLFVAAEIEQGTPLLSIYVGPVDDVHFCPDLPTFESSIAGHLTGIYAAIAIFLNRSDRPISASPVMGSRGSQGSHGPFIESDRAL